MTQEKKSGRKLLGFWIYPKFQGLLLAVNAALTVFTFGVIIALSKRSYEELRMKGVLSNLPEGHPYFQLLELQFETFRNHLAISFAISTVLVSLAILFLSHRLAGPIVRLRGVFTRISDEGFDPSRPVTFRKGDFFGELPELINRALLKVSGRR